MVAVLCGTRQNVGGHPQVARWGRSPRFTSLTKLPRGGREPRGASPGAAAVTEPGAERRVDTRPRVSDPYAHFKTMPNRSSGQIVKSGLHVMTRKLTVRLPPFTPQTLLKVKMPTVTRTLRWQGCKSVALENCHWIQNLSVSTAFHQHLHAWLHTRAPTTRMTYSWQHCHPSLELEATVMPLGVDRINTLWCFLPTGVLCNTVKE